MSYDIGGQIDHARNDLLAKTYRIQLKARHSANVNTKVEAGIKFVQENLQDFTNEWQMLNYKGYNQNVVNIPIGIPDDEPLNLRYHIGGENNLFAKKLSGYTQFF